MLSCQKNLQGYWVILLAQMHPAKMVNGLFYPGSSFIFFREITFSSKAKWNINEIIKPFS